MSTETSTRNDCCPTCSDVLLVSSRRLAAFRCAKLWLIILMFLVVLQPLLVQAQENNRKQVEVSSGVHLTLPSAWTVARQSSDTAEIDYAVPLADTTVPRPATMVAPKAQIMVFVERRASVKEALARLVEIASETPGQPDVKSLAGFPCIAKVYSASLPQSGDSDRKSTTTASARFGAIVLAVDKRVIHFTVVQAPRSSGKLFIQAMGIVDSVQIDDMSDRGTLRARLRDLQSDLQAANKRLLTNKKTQSLNSSKYVLASPPRGALPPAENLTPAARRYSHVQDGAGELEVAVSTDGQDVVLGANSGVSFSHDAGQTFQRAAIPEPTDDPSVTVGKSGTFYYSWIGRNKNVASVAVSSDHGEHFRFSSNAAAPPGACPSGQTCVDQPHIAADRWSYSATGADRVYVVWRDMSGNLKSPKVSCSADGGQTWPTTKTVYDTASDIYPRLSVGSDGALFIIFATTQTILLNKYSSCENGLQIADGFPVTVTSFTNVSCPVPGLDRCNNGNILSSPTVAEDDLDSNHVYVAWATATVPEKNEDIIVADSMDGGHTFPRSTRLNAQIRARRFMPWVTTYSGTAYVNWYDRRYAFAPGAASNDLTRYMGASASVTGGKLVAAKEVDLSHIDDPQCSNLWPSAPRSDQDALLCSTPGQTAGRCYGTNTPCDFNIPCPGGRQCLTGRGLPKYGDYNGMAAIAGKLYSFWTSIQPPSGVTVSSGDPNNSLDTNRLHIFGLIETLPRQ
jgi:hypothetical protein